jgi:hypothetical protein
MPATAKPVRGASRKAKRRETEHKWDVWRDAIWDRDESRSRASGVVLDRTSLDERRRGECAHLVSRSAAPEIKFRVENGVLLSAEEHRLSDPRTAGAAGRALLLIEPFGRDGELRGDRTLTFTRVDATGHVLWTRTS